MWIVLGVAALGCLTWLTRHWISEQSRTRDTASRHRTWAAVTAELPDGSRLTGVERDGRTTVEVGTFATDGSTQENRGGR